MTDPASPIAPSTGDIVTLAQALAEARREAETGVLIDLAGLEDRVAILCAAAESLPRSEARALLGPLGDLVAALDPLAAALKSQHTTRDAALDGRDDPHTARQRAAAAYRRGPAGTTPPGTAPVPSPPDSEPA